MKHQVATHDRELRDIRRQTEQTRDRTAILRAEWALLNEPDRLRQVAMRHLPLEAMQPQHFTRAAEIERRLRPAVAFAGAPNILAPLDPQPGSAPVMLAAAPAPPRGGRAPADPRAPEAPAPQALAAAVAEQRAARPANPLPAMPARPAPLRDTNRGEPTMQARTPPAATPQPAPRPAAPAVEPVIRTARAPMPENGAVSSLGGLGRPMLAPPVPFSAAQAATPGATPLGMGR